MKRKVYLLAFSILGLILGFFLHELIEIFYIKLLLSNYETFGLGLSFGTWFTIHKYFALAMTALGLIWGFYQGKKWWRVLYVEQKYRKWMKRPLKQNF